MRRPQGSTCGKGRGRTVVQIEPRGSSGIRVPFRAVLSGAEMARRSDSLPSRSGDVGHPEEGNLSEAAWQRGPVPSGRPKAVPTARTASPSQKRDLGTASHCPPQLDTWLSPSPPAAEILEGGGADRGSQTCILYPLPLPQTPCRPPSLAQTPGVS